VKIALVGCGYIAQAEHIPNWRQLPGADLVAVVDNRSALAEEVGEYYRVPSFSSMQAALAEAEVDAVDICTPPASHAGLVEEAARAGKHVLVEKPFADSAETARTALASATIRGVVVMVGYPRPFDFDVAYLTDLISSGSLGRVLGLHTVFKISHPASYTRIGDFERVLPVPVGDGSAHDLRLRLLEQSVHHLNLFGLWFGSRPVVDAVRWSGRLWSVSASAGGIPLTHFNAGQSGHGEEIWAYFEKGSVHVRPWSPHLPSTYGSVTVTPTGGAGVYQPVLARRNPYLVMLESFQARVNRLEDWRADVDRAVGDLELIDDIVAWFEQSAMDRTPPA